MLASVAWLNRLLDPAGLSADQVEHALMNAGFPIESRETLPGGDVRLDVEITSNRGDCLCHAGLAREIAASTGRRFLQPPRTPPDAIGSSPLTLTLAAREGCPRFTARVLEGVRVGPSPAWLRTALEAIGQRPISNVVDVTNFVLAELGHPSHVFDFDRLAGGALVVRGATEGEALTTLDGKARTLRAGELVVADGARAQSLAGVIGGADSEVSERTTRVVLEVATWDPATIRRAARRLGIRTDAGHRFERIVDPRMLDAASDRAASLILELAGGKPAGPMLSAGAPPAPPVVVTLRPARVRSLLGIDVPVADITRILGALGFAVAPGTDGSLACTVPAWRPDVTREVDLIEEVARLRGLDAIPVLDTLRVRVRGPQARERAVTEIGHSLTALGFNETVTSSFVAPALAAPFMPPGLFPLNTTGERRVADPTLRPSVLAGLILCRRTNEDARNRPAGGVRLFEIASVFAQDGAGGTVERRNLAMLVDASAAGSRPAPADAQLAIRRLRQAVENVVRAMRGTSGALEFRPGTPPWAAHAADATAEVLIDGTRAGVAGLLDERAVRPFGVDVPLAGAELSLDVLTEGFPSRSTVRPLPQFPGIERDVSILLPENARWDQVRDTVLGARLANFERLEFVGIYRGAQTGPGRKSVTARLHFRDGSRTLRREDADGEMNRLLTLLRERLGAEIRTE